MQALCPTVSVRSAFPGRNLSFPLPKKSKTMGTDNLRERSASCRLRDLLLDYLARPWVTVWPGADGLTMSEVLESYPEVVAAGQAPGREELLARHPELAEVVEEFFTAHLKQ